MLTVINDVHAGVERSAGTTTDSKLKLRLHIVAELKRLLDETTDDVMILGDLFDKFDSSLFDSILVYNVLKDWLKNNPEVMYLVAGNHDVSKTSNVVGNFDLMKNLLSEFINFIYIVEPAHTRYGYVIPHLPNQEAFNKALALVPEVPVLFLHCNYDNNFAAQSDQSLNISKEQVEACKAERILIAHEHCQKLSGKVTIPGNQIATSVSDWQGCNAKYMARVDIEGRITMSKVAEKSVEYTEQLWTDPQVTTHKFVKLVGTATAEQAAQVVSAVAKFRAISPAFVVANGVQIEADGGTAGFDAALEGVRAFDVFKALEEVLNESEMNVLKELE